MRKRWTLSWLTFWLYTALIFETSLAQPSDLPDPLLNLNDYALHGAGYFALFFISIQAFGLSKSSMLRTFKLPIAMGYCVLMASLTEWIQMYVPNRSCTFPDWATDLAGAGVAWILFHFATRRKAHEVF